MNFKRLIALMIVCVMVCSFFAACGEKEERTVNVSFVVTVDEDGEELDEELEIGHHKEVVVHTKNDPATVLKAGVQTLVYLAFEDGYELTSDGYSIKRVSKYAEHQEDDETTGYYTYWAAYVNGERTTSGRQSEVEIKDGDEIVFKYIEGSNPHENQDYAADSE